MSQHCLAFDRDEKSPFFERIRRLGASTLNRDFEPLTQATFVEGVLGYISKDPAADRDILLRGDKLVRATQEELQRLPLRNLFILEKDLSIAEIVFSYFKAVEARWESAWNARGRGNMLNRTNGFRGLMRAFGKIYLHIGEPGDIVNSDGFLSFFNGVDIEADSFTIDNFPPGTSGESKLYRIVSKQEDLYGRLISDPR